jgi:hypothetical protein
MSDLRVPKFVLKDKGINFPGEDRGLNIMLHLPSINRPILKSKGPIKSIEERQKEPYKSVKEPNR